jgi:hypothetical protein
MKGRRDLQRPLRGLDLRSDAGKRFKELFDEVRKTYGEHADPRLVTELATLRGSLEIAQVLSLQGDAKARIDIVRLGRLAKLLEREIALQIEIKSARTRTPSLKEHIARITAERPATGHPSSLAATYSEADRFAYQRGSRAR